MKAIFGLRTKRIVFVTAILLFSIQLSAFGFAGGTGQPDDPYQVSTARELISIGQIFRYRDKHFVLVNDIDLGPGSPGGRRFDKAVITSSSNAYDYYDGIGFTGSLDGNGYKIMNLVINAGPENYLGLFDFIDSNGLVRNIRLENVSIDGLYCVVGGLAGRNDGVIENCYVNGNISGDFLVGGLVGDNWFGKIRNCRSDVTIIGGSRSQMIGGLVGWHGGIIINCSARGDVTGGRESMSIGGLVGDMGFFGCDFGASRGVVMNCFATGNVSAGNESGWWGGIGGLIGSCNEGTVTNCWSSGNVSVGDSSNSIGGLIGIIGAPGGIAASPGMHMCTINNCYSIGRVDVGQDCGGFGGLVGYNYDGTAMECFWDIETSGISESDGGTGLNTNQMHNVQTYLDSGWDMVDERDNGTADLWQVPEGGGYPELTIFSEEYQRHTLAGSGTPEDPYQIASGEDLGAVNYYDWSACYKLTADVNLAGITWSSAPIWDFNGSFDGAGFIISNLKIHGGGYIGLFGILDTNAVVSELGIEDADITGIDRAFCIGAMAASNMGDVERCYASGTVSCGDNSWLIGGLVGNQKIGAITDCYAMANISCGDDGEAVGGLVGYISNATITNCYTTADVTAGDDCWCVGGLLGDCWKSTISSSYFLVASDGGGAALTDEQMKQQVSFVDWDFDDIWMICEGVDYPRLQWQNIQCEQ